MMYDVASQSKPFVGEEIGAYNKKFAQKFGKPLHSMFGENANLVTKLQPKALLQLM